MTDTNNSPLEGNVLFYVNPEPLDQSVHGTLGVNPTDKPYAFVAQTNIVPLTVTEFAAAALSYPIIFTGDNRQPVVVMGLRQGENLFVADDGEFRADAYVPAYVRRYPFVFADDKQNQRLILCIDRGAAIVAEAGENPLFVEGQPSDYTNMAMEFCNNFEQERQRTESFVQLIKDLDLLDTRDAVFTPRNPTARRASRRSWPNTMRCRKTSCAPCRPRSWPSCATTARLARSTPIWCRCWAGTA